MTGSPRKVRRKPFFELPKSIPESDKLLPGDHRSRWPQRPKSHRSPASPSSAGTPCWCRDSSAGPGAVRELPGTEGSRHRTWTRTPPAAAKTPPASTRTLSRCPGTSGTKTRFQTDTGSKPGRKIVAFRLLSCLS